MHNCTQCTRYAYAIYIYTHMDRYLFSNLKPPMKCLPLVCFHLGAQWLGVQVWWDLDNSRMAARSGTVSTLHQWLFLVPIKGGRWHIIPPIGSIYHLYNIYHFYIAFWGVICTTFNGNQKRFFIDYTLENWWLGPHRKGTSFFKPWFWGSMLIFQGGMPDVKMSGFLLTNPDPGI